MSRIAKNPSVRDLDAVSNLPDKNDAAPGVEMAPETSWLSAGSLDKLRQGAKLNGLSSEAYLHHLLDDDLERLRLLSYCQDRVIDANLPVVHEINQVINEELQHLLPTSEVHEFHGALEQLYNRLLDEKHIKTKLTKNRVAESQRLKIPRVAYFYYGATLSHACARWFHTTDVYLWHEMFSSESEVLFVGSPENVVVSYQVCFRLCQLFKKAKSQKKAQMGNWGSRKDMDEEANDYINLFARDVEKADCGYPDEETYEFLYHYVADNYHYTLR